ncbi:MAG TPA: hypothetical protein VN228_14915 [Pyrinomonadaceae bacterium]|nr:hypothetical protein [Pyrinomonadaceae bacterium]
MGEALTKVTIWLALLGYAGGAACLLLSRRNANRSRTARVAWTFGCAWFLAHVLCAFAFHYGWSHATAFAETARQTRGVTGAGFGGGVFVSYAFTLAWAADAVWWWVDEAGHLRRPRWLTYAWHGFFFFIVFNGTIVFERGPARWLGVAVCGGLALLWLVTAPRSRRARPEFGGAKG